MAIIDFNALISDGNRRRLDAWLARFIAGRQVVYSAWPCGRSPDTGRYEACTIFRDEQSLGANYDQCDYVMVQRSKENWKPYWPPERTVEQLDGDEWVEYYADVKPVPFYTSAHRLYPGSVQHEDHYDSQVVEPLFSLARHYVGEGSVELRCCDNSAIASVQTDTMNEPVQSSKRTEAVMALAEALFEAETGGSFGGLIVEEPEVSLPFL